MTLPGLLFQGNMSPKCRIMQAMAPNTQERWQAAVMPVALDVIDGYRATRQAHLEAVGRLEDWGAPYWAIYLRGYCVGKLARLNSPLLPTFMVRAEVALVGLGLLFPDKEQRQEAYCRVALRFLEDMLRPFADWVARTDDARVRTVFGPTLELYQLCQELCISESDPRWRAVFHAFHQLGRSAPAPPMEQVPESGEALQSELPDRFGMTYFCTLLAMYAFSSPLAPFQYEHTALLFSDRARYVALLRGAAESSELQRVELGACLLLNALERECPAPEWMPRTSLGQSP